MRCRPPNFWTAILPPSGKLIICPLILSLCAACGRTRMMVVPSRCAMVSTIFHVMVRIGWGFNHQTNGRNARQLRMSSNFVLKSLSEFALSGENTMTHFLNFEAQDQSKQFIPRQTYKCHGVLVDCETVPNPYFIAGSVSCATSIGLDPSEFNTKEFIEAFSGNNLPDGLDSPYCTVYGCHCYGQWFGQLGDGRAMGIGEVALNPASSQSGEMRYELQLKGCGRSPYSRGFDGRAVLRSTIREFLGDSCPSHQSVMIFSSSANWQCLRLCSTCEFQQQEHSR